MFTGIVYRVGKLVARDPGRLWVEHGGLRAELGDSLAVNGVCLTVTEMRESSVVAFDLSMETTQRTTLGGLRSGTSVNLEPALAVGGPLGGHWVLGHVDCVGKLGLLHREGQGWVMEVLYPRAFSALLADKAAVAVDGVSLTPFCVRRESFRCAVVPHTWNHTNFPDLHVGDRVNLEFDILAKYVVGWRER